MVGTDPSVPRFADPETAAEGATELIAPAHRRTLHEDLSTGTVVLTDHGDAGTIRFDASGTEMSSTATDVWEITRGDPLSATVTCDRSWTVRWGEICAEVRTTSTMWCDATHFHTNDSVVALEDGQEIFASRRQATHARDHV